MKLLYIGKHIEDVEWSIEDTEISAVFCNNAVEARNALKNNKDIDAIICEYSLPGNNGIFFYDNLKAEKEATHIPFVLLMEEHSDKIFQEAFSKGISDYFVIGATDTEQIILRTKRLSTQQPTSIKTEPKNKTSGTYKFPLSKRIFDIVVASSILLVLSPLLIMVVLAIRLESKGKVYYIAKRVGRKTFDFYKLRSMRTGSDKLLKQLAKEKNQYNNSQEETKVDKEEECPRCAKLNAGEYCSPVKYTEKGKICDYWYNEQKQKALDSNSSFIKIIDDPRITRVGKIIRNTSIDELPQLINVIKGDMSLVGNRPLPVYEAELLTQDQKSKRFLAPAGITGLWQVELRGKGGDMSEEERIALDNKYAEYFIGNNYSLWFDLKILMRTVPALFQKSTV
ncbi:MAG: sugar transferase [Winogradskyella sp.]